MVFEGFKMMEYNFVITTPLEVEETFSDRVILTGTVLRLDSATKNGRIYQIEEAEQIAQGLVGMPVYFGVRPPTLVNTPLGLAVERGKHDRDGDSVGRVFKTLHDKANNIIKAWVEVWNNSRFPDLVQRIKKGWGFSIGGIAQDMKNTGVLNSVGRAIKKVFGMKPNHLQLIEPEVPRGQEDAKVEDVQAVQETLEFDPCPWGMCETPTANTGYPVTGGTTIPTIVTETVTTPTTQETVIIPTVQETVLETPKQILIKRTTKRVIYVLDGDSYVV
jgi:hypothetical protein